AGGLQHVEHAADAVGDLGQELAMLVGLRRVRVEAVDHDVEDASAEAFLDQLGDQLQLLAERVDRHESAVLERHLIAADVRRAGEDFLNPVDGVERLRLAAADEIEHGARFLILAGWVRSSSSLRRALRRAGSPPPRSRRYGWRLLMLTTSPGEPCRAIGNR